MTNNQFSARVEYIFKLLEPSPNDKIVCIGISNIPEIEIAIENKVRECVTLDIDKNKLKKASKFLKKTKLIQGDILKKLPFHDTYFDKAIVIEVLEHLEDDNLALREIRRVLKPNGILIVGVPNKHPLHIFNPVKYAEHKRHYSNYDIRELVYKNGFLIKHYNVVEDWTLLANLYIHLFNKFILKRSRPFHFFKKSASQTYKQINADGLDIILKAVKVS